ncbi:hypothetical protein [Cellulomonas aerilata]|uniref:Uncharacterized protein n=1 Tax=Cellulomonas aerilata TaxID=515326 RepID=A0A512D9Y4_9CELL|nr:hypothetical protein [Cellulomonas aerilata]GEO33187.1 hypothetical protein CAE01nite_09120 [Cellulomonas aerilata]
MSRNQRRNRRNKSGGRQTAQHDGRGASAQDRTTAAVRPRPSTETKSSLRTTELLAYAATALAIVMTALALDEDGRGGSDPFGAETAIRYLTYLTVGYMVARGLAKSGSWERRVEHDDDAPGTVAGHAEEPRETVEESGDADVEVDDQVDAVGERTVRATGTTSDAASGPAADIAPGAAASDEVAPEVSRDGGVRA